MFIMHRNGTVQESQHIACLGLIIYLQILALSQVYTQKSNFNQT